MLLLIIRFYRTAVRPFLRKTCLFQCSCSRFVESEYRSYGAKRGWKALFTRYQDCREGYHFIEIDKERFMVTQSGRRYPESQLSDSIIEKMNEEMS